MHYSKYFAMKFDRDPQNTCNVLRDRTPRTWKTGERAEDRYELVQQFHGPDAQALAEAKAQELNAREFARVRALGPLTRYQTMWYCTIVESEVNRLAAIDHTPPDKIRVTPGLTIVHNTTSWTLWSDGRFTKPLSELPAGGDLSPDAVNFVSTVRGADGGTVHLPGGLLALTRVQEVLDTKDLDVGSSRGVYAAERIEDLHVRWTDGSEGHLYTHTAGYFEGYMYNVYGTLEEARAAMGGAPGPEGIYIFSPDQWQYDPDLGFMPRDQE